MPLYEYVCPSCQLNFERLRPMSGADDTPCPRCHEVARRKLSTFASFSKSAEGDIAPISGSGSACNSCSASSCATCGL
ncbi:MAG TPA: zinc ribbon domain-containing protein [Dehalococcoidia bacterium]|nr:zinc ribbon domain-containing protein [Dehalococcoidia bacterium]